MRVTSKHCWIALGVAAAIVATAACSSSKSSSQATSATSAAAEGSPSTSAAPQTGGTTRWVSATEIKVGGMGSSPIYFTDKNMGIGAAARFARANATGEIPGGRKIVTVAFGDDKADAATSVQEERRLINQEGVFAIVPATTPFMQAAVPNQTHTPVFGYGISPAWCGTDTASYFFGYNGCVVPPNPATAGDNEIEMKDAAIKEGIVPQGATAKMAIMGDDNSVGQQAVAQVYAGSVGAGMKVVYAKAPTPAPPAVVGDYTPYVRDVLATHPDIITTVGVSGDYIGIGKALQAAGFKGMYIVPAEDPTLAKLIGPSYAWTTWAPVESAPTTPTIQQMVSDIQAYAPGTPLGTQAQAGWLAADQFVVALQKTGANLTAEALQQVAATMTYERAGFIGPTAYPQNWQYTAPACHAVEKTDGTSYTVVLPYACSPTRYPIKPYAQIVTP